MKGTNSEATACFCIGPQNGEPLCPCAMRNVVIRDGRYIQKEIDLGPVRPDWFREQLKELNIDLRKP